MANPAPKPRPRGAERVRRVNAKRPPVTPPVVLSPSGEDRAEAVVAWAHRLLARLGHSRGGSTR